MMATDTQHPDDARQALEEVRDASLLTEGLLQATSGTDAPKESTLIKVVSDSEVDMLRERAKRERLRGQKNLTRRYDGVASVLKKVKINERVIGSAFERFFYVIENGIFVITRRGAMFLGDAAAEKLLDTIVGKITEMESKVAADLAGVQIQVSVHKEVPGFVTPEYTKPSAEHEVQLRTRLSSRVVGLFESQDQIIANLQTLHWNGAVEISAIEDQEAQLKRDIRALATFIARTLRGMRNKVSSTISASSETAVIADTAAAPSNNETIEAAA